VVAVVQTYSAEGIFSRLSVVCRDVHDLIDLVNYCALVPCTFFKKSRAHSERTCERASERAPTILTRFRLHIRLHLKYRFSMIYIYIGIRVDEAPP
jgi:hypothetical protein